MTIDHFGSMPAGKVIEIEREFQAPRELVFRAWTEEKHLMKWLCPKDFEVLFVTIDLRVGGSWRSGMKSPLGVTYVMRGIYIEIAYPQRLVFTHQWEDNTQPGHEPRHETLINVTLADLGERTKMRFKVSGLTTDESRDGQAQGWSEAFGNLEASLLREQELR